MKVALASMAAYPPDGVVDDEGPLVDALVASGADVVRPAWTADFDWAGVDVVLLRTTWDYQLRHREFLAWCERVAAVTRLVHGPEIVAWNIDKRYLRVLAARGIPIADTTWLAPGDVLPERLPERGFMKPIIGANAYGTLRWSSVDRGAIEAQRAAFAELGGFMIQPYLSSVETEGELSAICIEGRYTHGVRKVPRGGDYRVQEDWGARDEAYRFGDDERALVEHVVATASSIVGSPLVYARVDFLRDDSGRLVVNELELIEPCLFLRHDPGATPLRHDPGATQAPAGATQTPTGTTHGLAGTARRLVAAIGPFVG